ncbi:MAG: hypothetical protein WD333_08345 [Dehalococcoidia bacterium]
MAERATGTRDEHYNLISVLYHALQGGETSATYEEDAGQAGDQELADFFRKVRGQYKEAADEAKKLLGQRIG